MELKKGYKQTEVGVIPEDWDVSQLGTLAETSSGTTPSRAMHERYFRNGSIAWVKTMDLTNSDIVITSERVTEHALKETCLRIYPVGTVLLAMYGGFQQIGRTGLLRMPAAVNQAITAIQPKTDKLVSEYLLGTLNHRVDYWKTVASSSRKDPNISSQDIRDFPICYPSPREQRAIAAALSDVDGLIGGLEQLIAKKRDLKQAAMQQLLTGKKRLAGFRGEWVVKQLGVFGTFKNGINKSKEDFGHGFPFVNLMDVFGIARVSNRVVFGLVNSSSAERELYELKKGDVLFVRSSVKPEGVGLTGLVQEDLPNTVFSGFLIRFRDAGQLAYEYKEHCFGEAGFRKMLIASSSVSANTNINQDSLKALTFVYPSDKREQTAIAEVLSDMDAELTSLEQRRDKTRDLKQGMMQALLTGRTRLVESGKLRADSKE